MNKILTLVAIALCCCLFQHMFITIPFNNTITLEQVLRTSSQQQNDHERSISQQLTEIHNSMFQEDPPQRPAVQQSANVQTEQAQIPNLRSLRSLPLRERLARSVELRNQQREADIRTQNARTDTLNSQARYYQIAMESHRLYNENLRLRNEMLQNSRSIFRARSVFSMKILQHLLLLT